MDAFIEKIVTKRRTPADFLLMLGIVAGAVLLSFASMVFLTQYVGQFAMLLAVGVFYLGYRLITGLNVEYEYLLTNGSLDIDKIIAQRKRVRVFSGDCKEFDALARVKSRHHGPHITKESAVIFAAASMNSEDLYFASLSYKGKKTVVYFEPDVRMLEIFARFIPGKMPRD